jgi:hypothetical protein
MDVGYIRIAGPESTNHERVHHSFVFRIFNHVIAVLRFSTGLNIERGIIISPGWHGGCKASQNLPKLCL